MFNGKKKNYEHPCYFHCSLIFFISIAIFFAVFIRLMWKRKNQMRTDPKKDEDRLALSKAAIALQNELQPWRIDDIHPLSGSASFIEKKQRCSQP